jgi:ubiquitin-like modifier-activating enzyme ATG7
MAQDQPVKFIPFSSAVESSFWVKYCQEKLEYIRLRTDIDVTFHAFYNYQSTLSPALVGQQPLQPRLQCQESSLLLSTTNDAAHNPSNESSISGKNELVSARGTLFGYNTKEEMQTSNKNEVLHDFFISKFLPNDASEATGAYDERVIDSLTSVLLLVYADLKNHQVLYWFGMPALLLRNSGSLTGMNAQYIQDIWNVQQQQSVMHGIHATRLNHLSSLPPYFILRVRQHQESSSDSDEFCVDCRPLSKKAYLAMTGELQPDEQLVFAFVDPIGAHYGRADDGAALYTMGWPFRNLIAYLSFHLNLAGAASILSFRATQPLRRVSPGEPVPPSDSNPVGYSILLDVRIPEKSEYEWPLSASEPSPKSSPFRVVGWELNLRGKSGPRLVDLRPLLDQNHLAIQAADLNLKLMKWRMIPDLDVQRLQSTRVLLIGAGTLGCNVARTLLGWGIRKFTIVDYGTVSYSNPVRQSLFTLADCHSSTSGKGAGGKLKAVAAADSLKAIAPDVESVGIHLSIPMPGHSESMESVAAAVNQLDDLIRQTDVVYLLTDTRESRWLPTVMAATHGKLLINAALGFDSWLVMRHGGGLVSPESNRLGCYFCNDVVAPENSTRHRTLDQQCTVTRPGLAPIASALAVELMVATLHHPEQIQAPAPSPSRVDSSFAMSVPSSHPTSSGPLGMIPHQVRGSLVTYSLMHPTVPAFAHCTACSEPVVHAYRTDSVAFVLRACSNSDHLEEVAGLTAFRNSANAELPVENWDNDSDDGF